MKDPTELSEACRELYHAIGIIKSNGAARRADRRSPAKKEQSILPVKLVGLMILDGPGMDGAPAPRAFTTITYSARGIEFGTDERRRDKILNRLKTVIAKLEKEHADPVQ